jgi:alpha-ketoglutarate-dependent taurine dioxygenase
MSVTTVKAVSPVKSIGFRPLAGRIGAEVQGVVLSGELPQQVVTQLLEGLWKHKVLFFRGQQQLTDATHEAFAERLGTPVAHPTLPSIEGTRYVLPVYAEHSRANDWHTDATFMVDYPMASILRAITLPGHGGDTVFSNTAAAYAEMPPVLQGLADQLWVRHTNSQDIYAKNPNAVHEGDRANSRAKAKDSMKRQLASTIHETDHPVIRVHPHSGEKTFVLGNWAQRILDVSVADSTHLMALFHGHITRLDNTVRWTWLPGDVAIWDNYATQHYAIDDYGDQRRWMRRVTLHGEIPVSVQGRKSTTRIVA